MHIIGGEMTYECLGQVQPGINRYRFTMKMYRDCLSSGAQFDNPASFAIYRGSYTSNTRIDQFNINIFSTNNLTPAKPDCITQAPNLCVEQATYIFTRDLPIITSGSYFIVHQRCCRNVTINNIAMPGNVGGTYMVELTPLAQQACNNSPVFDNFPPIIICANTPLFVDQSATDAEGDQLVYRFCSAFAGGGPLLNQPLVFSCDGAVPTPPCAPPFTEVTYVPPYSAINPMGGNPQVAINPVTGLITGRPTVIGQFVVTVCVEEYRNGQLLSMIRREFQFNVAPCSPTVIASIDSAEIIGPKQYLINSCGNRNIRMINTSQQQQFISNFRWEFDLNGVPYVNEAEWTPVIPFPDTGTYFGRLLLNPNQICNDTAYIVVNVFPGITADFDFKYDTCVAGPVEFINLSSGEGGITDYDWTFGVPGGSSKQKDPVYLYPVPGNHTVTLTVTDKNNCVARRQKTITWFPVPPLLIVRPNSFLGCQPAEVTFAILSSPVDESYEIVWDMGDGTIIRNELRPTHVYTETGRYSVSLKLVSPIGCETEAVFTNIVRVEPSPVADFSFSPSELTVLDNTAAFTDLSQGADRWYWRFDRFGTSNQQNPVFAFPDTGLVTITQIVTHPRGCQDSISKTIDVRPIIFWHMPNAFTPNGDGKNEGFRGKGFLFGVADFQMSIWNRWGEMLFETRDPDQAWDGRIRNSGKMAPPGVYVYLVTFTGPRGQRYEYKGYATIVN
ncbi:MAG: PKD domain-containing protein [Saprospiraceae bacterium]